MDDNTETAPELQISEWINADQPVTLKNLRGRIVVLHAFQMLCPGCVQHGIPQAKKIHDAFDRKDLVVLGLHTVFEHHSVMGPAALKVFMHEYRIPFPVAVDHPGDSALPRTMQAFRLQGTPSLLIFDRQGELRAHHFGQVHDLIIGAEIATLLAG